MTAPGHDCGRVGAGLSSWPFSMEGLLHAAGVEAPMACLPAPNRDALATRPVPASVASTSGPSGGDDPQRWTCS